MMQRSGDELGLRGGGPGVSTIAFFRVTVCMLVRDAQVQ